MRSRTVLAFLLISSGSLLYGCAAQQPYNPYRIEKADFRQRVHTIALMPTKMPTDIENREAVQQKFAAMLAGKLQLLGFTALAPDKAGEVFDRVRKESGNLFDPTTGERNKEKQDEADRKALAEVAERYHADAVLYSAVYPVKAAFRNGVASWLGTSQRIETGGSLALRMLGGVTVSGTVGATAIGVVIGDTTGKDLYSKAAGLESLASYGAGGFKEKPLSELFLDEQRNTAAIDHALLELAPEPEATAAK
ncbi:MAG TPA: hypothetical protein VGK20_17235 [Candidatus Binatia bacterium]|jgi:hypothetical protein